MAKKPNFFIVGAPKCGTTSMWQYLKQHPEIFMTALKEPHYFGADLGPRRIIETESQYLKLFAKAREQKRLGEASA